MLSARRYDAFVLRWVDGDTVELAVVLEDYGFLTYKVMVDHFRLVKADGSEFDADEIHGPERRTGEQARLLAMEVAPPSSKIKVVTFKPPGHDRKFKPNKRGKYGRWLAYVPGVPEAIIKAGLGE